MIAVDFHSHTLFSGCGVHTHVEMLTHARNLGMQGLAITDHGPEVGRRFSTTFFDRLHQPVPGIKLLKGIEANLRGLDGEIDVPAHVYPHLDVVLLGFHGNTPTGLGPQVYTRALVRAMECNPCIDLLAHLHPSSSHPVELETVVRAAAAHGVAVELNHSKLLLGRADPEAMRLLVRACKVAGCRMAVCSDAHVLNELGRDEHALPLLAQEAFPAALWVNETAEKAFAFVASRRSRKRPENVDERKP